MIRLRLLNIRRPTEEEIDYLLRHVSLYFDIKVTRNDIKSCWSGLRPLVADPKAADTSNLVRDHVISLSPGGLLTIVGGKWTSYRRMAEDTINQAIKAFGLSSAQTLPDESYRGCRWRKL